MRDAGALEPLRELDEIALAGDSEDDSVRVGRQRRPWRRLAGRVNELGGEVSKREIAPDDDVVKERFVGRPARFCGAFNAIGLGCRGLSSPGISLRCDVGSWPEL